MLLLSRVDSSKIPWAVLLVCLHVWSVDGMGCISRGIQVHGQADLTTAVVNGLRRFADHVADVLDC